MNKNDLSKIKLSDLINLPNISIRVRNCILVATENLDFPIDTVQDFLNTEIDVKSIFLRMVPNMGLKSFNELDILISNIVEINNNDLAVFDSIMDTDRQQYDAIKVLLDRFDQIESRSELKLVSDNILSLSLIDVINLNVTSVRLRNTIISSVKSLHELPFPSVGDYLNAGGNAIRKMLSIPNLGKDTALEFDSLIHKIVSGEKLTNSNKVYENSTDEIIGYVLSKNISVRLRNAFNAVSSSNELSYMFFKEYFSIECKKDARKKIMLAIKNIGFKSVVELDSLFSENIEDINNIIDAYKHIDEQKHLLSVEQHFTENPKDYIYKRAEGYLKEKEMLVLRHRYGVGGESLKTLEDVGAILFVTRERIRQIENNALRKLEAIFKDDGLDIFYTFYKDIFIKNIFGSNVFLSEKRLQKSKKGMPAWLRIYADSSYGNIKNFLSFNYIYNVELKGWLQSKESLDTSTYLPGDNTDYLKYAISKSHWPIRFDSLVELTKQPKCVLIEQISVDDKYSLNTINNITYFHIKNVKLKDAMRFILRKHMRAMSRDEIKSEYFSMFNKTISVGQVGNTLGEMEDALIVNRGIYNLYENMNISDEILDFVRLKTEKYLLDKQEFISSKIIIRDLRDLHQQSSILHSLNGYSLLGILQDDPRFDCHRGFMIGLYIENFTGEFIDLETEIVELMRNKGKPITLKEIVHELSDRRELITPSLNNMLDANILFSQESHDSYGLANVISENSRIDSQSIDASILSDWDI